MEKESLLKEMNGILLDEMPENRSAAETFPPTEEGQYRLYRSLVNIRPPNPMDPKFLGLQDRFLEARLKETGTVKLEDIPPSRHAHMRIWQGDITRLEVDAIVNAANSGMLGCFQPCHACIDNCIHTAAGIQLRDECARIMREQGHEEPAGCAKVTGAYNLPCRYVIHTVGPIISGRVTAKDRNLLRSCYISCLEAAEEKGCASIAFCCISTGVFCFPAEEAAEIAVDAVEDYLGGRSGMEVVFDVFKDSDRRIYERLLR